MKMNIIIEIKPKKMPILLSINYNLFSEKPNLTSGKPALAKQMRKWNKLLKKLAAKQVQSTLTSA